MTLSVNAILKSVIAALAAGVIVVLSLGAWSSWTRVATVNRIAGVAEATTHMFTALHNLRVDRASTFRDLNADRQTTTLTTQHANARAAEMPALHSALAVLERVDFPGQQAGVTALRQAIEKLTALQKESMTALAQPKASRRPTLAREFFKEADDLIGLLDSLSSQLSRSIKLEDAFIDQLMEIKQLGWIARNSGGDASVMISNGMGGQALPADPLVVFHSHLAKVDTAWVVLQDVAKGLAMPPRFTAALDTANREFFSPAFLEQRLKMLKALIAGQKPDISVQDWTNITVPKLGLLLNVAEAALDVAKEYAEGQRVQATRKLWSELGLLTLAVLFAVGMMFLVSRRVTGPLRQIQQAMTKLATGDFDVVLPGLHRKDEIGDVANAVERFKVLASEKARTESEEMMKRQKAEAERQAQTAKAEAAAREMQAEAQRKQAEAQAEAQAKIAEEQRRNAEAVAKASEEQAKLVQMLAAALGKVSEGDLTVHLPDAFTGDYEKIKNDFNTMVAQLKDTITVIAASAREVTNAAAEISTSTTDLSQRTEQQAAGLEQTSASMEQISATVKNNATNAQQANQLTASTREVADRSGAVVGQAVDAMSRIEESSRKIGDIIGVIDEIARQTNLLALNAAVEAARAGDAGRGFAVVASEVRNLAQRSSQAAKDIKDLITNSSGQVKEGVDLVNKAGASLQEIMVSIKKVSDIVADIANASGEQATGLEQVNKALTQLDEVTQQNSALVEENAATAKTLEQQSSAMAERVSFFTLEGGDQHKAARAA